jgi:FMN phosphatase YigB (HAD superfamily)
VADEVIIDAYRACYRDGLPARELWHGTGCEWRDGALETDFLACYELNPGVIDFLEGMRESGVPVFGLSNDVAEWAGKRRATLGIEGYFSGWVISGEVKAFKPQPGIYQHLLNLLPCPPGACLFVDDRAANLEAAQAAGLQSALFSATPEDGFRCVPDFAALREFVLRRHMELSRRELQGGGRCD